jgi:RNA polymerase sigma-70 factor, ECF subfamily
MSKSPVNESAAQRRARDADQLVAAARAGDPFAFDRLVRRFRPRIYALALHMSGSASDADDITQDAFVQAYRNLGHFEGRSHFFTWLYRITMRKAIDAQRERKRSGLLRDDVRLEEALRIDAAGDPRLALELRETYAALLRGLDALSPTLKSAVVLTALQGLSYQEAAVVLGTSEGAVAVRIHEGRKLLRQALEQHTRRNLPRRVAARSQTEPAGDWHDLAFALASLL